MIAFVPGGDGVIENHVFENLESYLIVREIDVATSGGIIKTDLSYSGEIYAFASAASIGLEVTPEHYTDLINERTYSHDESQESASGR